MDNNSIQFFSGNSSKISDKNSRMVLRISLDGIWADPEIPATETALVVLDLLDQHIKNMIKPGTHTIGGVRWMFVQLPTQEELDD